MDGRHRLIALIALFAIIDTINAAVGEFSPPSKCFYRCTAECARNLTTVNALSLQPCIQRCQSYRNEALCDSDDPTCWAVCKDLGAPANINTPPEFHFAQNGTNNLFWDTVPGAVYYIIQYRHASEPIFKENEQLITQNSSFINLTIPNGAFCDAYVVRVAAIAPFGLSNFTRDLTIDPPQPFVSNPKLKVDSMKYLDVPLETDFYEANGTVLLTFSYQPPTWALGDSDLEVTPLFHMINCETPDLSQGVPVPDFYPGPSPNTIQARLGSDMMTRSCRFVYYIQSMKSKTCGTETFMHSPPSNALQTLEISCETVEDNPCDKTVSYPAPLCGNTAPGNFTPIFEDGPDTDPSVNFTVNYTFVPVNRQDIKFEYFQVFYGLAAEYQTSQQRELLGVNQTTVIGNVTNCLNFTADGHCHKHTPNMTVLIPGIHWNTLYGLRICGIRDVRNLTFPRSGLVKANQIRSERLFVDSDDYKTNHTGLIVGLVVGLLLLFIFIIMGVCLWNNRRQKKKNKLYQIKIDLMEKEKEIRYTEFPKKNDIWEIERRNLIIHNDKKLGAGAFGAVYMGKMIGMSKAHKDANSPLGINLLRAENCEVAVKMLPEHADDLSRQEFLREIALMKTLGYHERLVNMLACITESEPLCLVVEYCSDGDLLQFLRERCKYMMKLDEHNVNYREPGPDDDFEEDMILTMKQLLMFSVQISYGLEYLSQKGFVHRDVAARNVLVSHKTSAKIGDFGLCRFIYADSSNYKSKGGRLPLKWMSPEAIRHYEFSSKSDVWSFGILLFEIITLGGSPYPGIQPEDMLSHLESGGVMEMPDNCPDNYYSVMCSCWNLEPAKRPEFSSIRQRLAAQLEEVTEEYSYLQLNAERDYYNVQYGEDIKIDTIVIPESKATVIDAPEDDNSPVSEVTTTGVSSSLQRQDSMSLDSLPLDEDTENTTNIKLEKMDRGFENTAYEV